MDVLSRKVLHHPFRLLCVYYSPRNGRSQFIPGVVIILCLVLDLAVVTFYAPRVFDMSTRVRFLLDISQVYAPIISYSAIIIEAVQSRHRLATIWRNVQGAVEIFERDLKIPTFSRLQNVFRKFKIFAIFIQLVCTGTELVFLGGRSAILLYILYVQLIGFLLQCLEHCQTQITCATESHFPNRLMRFDRQLVDKQLHVRRIFHKVVIISRLLNESFKWSLLLNFLTNVFCICVAWFYNYVAIRFGNKYLFESVICSLPLIVITLAAIWACEASSGCFQRLVRAVHLGRGGGHQLRRISYQFSLQLQSERIEWVVFRMFKLNSNLLTAIIATIGIYLVIFIQFTEVERRR